MQILPSLLWGKIADIGSAARGVFLEGTEHQALQALRCLRAQGAQWRGLDGHDVGKHLA